jgi:catechol 2,3-dioxygenase-like lactoylglutathione lyase family enzyme
MTGDQRALRGRATNLFAGIPVSDFARALDWYTRLLGAPPAFFPNDHEAVWMLGEHQWLYIIVAEGRAGGAVQTVLCDGLDDILAEISVRGLVPDDEERPAEGTRKVMFHDPDGNEIGIGSVAGG